jgi:hypothetical protein
MLNRYHLIAITGGSYTRLHLRLQGQREGQREGQRTDVTCQRQRRQYPSNQSIGSVNGMSVCFTLFYLSRQLGACMAACTLRCRTRWSTMLAAATRRPHGSNRLVWHRSSFC